MTNRSVFALLLIICLNSGFVFAQDKCHHTHDRNEIGFGFGTIYIIGDKVWGQGMHLHYFRSVKPDSRFSWGCGLEQIWAKEERHFSINAGVKYELFEKFDLGVMPGVTFCKHSGDGPGSGVRHSRFSLHFEAAYNLFNWGNFHLAPVVDFAWSRGDSHLMPGLHIAYCF